MGDAMNDATRWRVTALGLRIKIVAAVALLVVPVLALVAYQVGTSAALFAAAGIAGALCLDLCGRSMCLTAPVRRRYLIVLSVALQAAAVVAVATLTFLERELGLYAGLALAACIQVVVAGLFTLFLGDVALALERPDLYAAVSRLQLSLSTGTMVATATTFYVAIVTAIVVALGLFTYGLGFCVGIPLGIVAVVPWVAIATVPLALMFFDYGRSVTSIRRAAFDAARRSDALAAESIGIEYLSK